MQHPTSVWIHIGRAKHTINRMVSVLSKGLCTLDLKPKMAAKWSNWAQIHALCTKIWHKRMNYSECAQLSLVYNSVHETCAKRFLLHHSVAFWSPYTHGRRTQRKNIDMTFSVYFPHPTKIGMSVSQLYPKLRIMLKKWHFHDTPVQLVQNVHRLPSCVIGRHVTLLELMPIEQESERHGEKDDFNVICVSLHKGPRTKMGCSVIQQWPKSHIIHK